VKLDETKSKALCPYNVPHLPEKCCMITLQQIQQDIQDLPEEAQILLIDFLEILKKRYPKPAHKNQSQEKSLYEKFDEIGLIGCVSTEENLSANYKQVLSKQLNSKYDHC
jgi:hypothetical protein